MGNGFHRVVITSECLGEQTLSVTCGTRTQNIQIHIQLICFPFEIQEGLFHDSQRFALILSVERIDRSPIFIHKHKLGCGGACINSQVGIEGSVRIGFQSGHLRQFVPFDKFLMLFFCIEEWFYGNSFFCRGCMVKGGMTRQLRQIHALRIREHRRNPQRGSLGNQDILILGNDNIFLPQTQALGINRHKLRVKKQRAAFKDDRRTDLQPLGQTAYGLFGHGMETGQGQVCLGHALIQQRLNVRLGKNTAPAGHIVDAPSLFGQRVQLFHRHFQESGHLIQKRTGSAGAASVHPHVGGHQPARIFVFTEEDNLGILAAQFNGHAGVGMKFSHGKGVGHHFLDVRRIQFRRQSPGAASAENGHHRFAGKLLRQIGNEFPSRLTLSGAVTFVFVMQKFLGVRVNQSRLNRCGAYIDSKPKRCLHEKCPPSKIW